MALDTELQNRYLDGEKYMSAEFYTEINYNGTVDDSMMILEYLKTNWLKKDSGKNDIYMNSIRIRPQKNNELHLEEMELDSLNTEKLKDYIKLCDENMTIMMMGPYGHYFQLYELTFFEEIAELAPLACFDGEMAGESYETIQSVCGKLKKSKLKLISLTKDPERYDEEKDEWIYSKSKITDIYDPINKLYIDDGKELSDFENVRDYFIHIGYKKMKPEQCVKKRVDAINQVFSYEEFLQFLALSEKEYSKMQYDEMLWQTNSYGYGNYGVFCQYIKPLSISRKQFDDFRKEILERRIVK